MLLLGGLVGFFFGTAFGATLLPLLGVSLGVLGIIGAILGPLVACFASWLLPMSYLVTPLGILLFVLNLPFVLGTLGPAALRFDRLTATIETTGGALVNFLFALSPTPATGFNLGNFTFLRLAPGAALAQSPFTGGGSGLSPHETVHTLTVAAFGGFYG